MKFKKRPVIIDAIQWNGSNEIEIFDFIGKELEVRRPPYNFEKDNDLLNQMINIFIPTLEGCMKADRMDWIIKGVKGEFYPCKPDIFEQTYEKAE